MNPNIDKPLPTEGHAAVDPHKLPAEAAGMATTDVEKLLPNELLPATDSTPQQTTSALPDPTMIALPAQQLSSGQPQMAGGPAMAQAGDTDTIIEKECISKAKAIVERTGNDPFTQTQEIGKVKAELLKRRYGKELKTSER
jgi:hypothetical protein